MEQSFSKATIRDIKELLTLLDPYANTWKVWTQSEACFLSPHEIRIIQNYLLTGAHLQSAEEFNIPEFVAEIILNRTKHLLQDNLPAFESWLSLYYQ
ncbi:MAG TPA: hypothetical protein VGF30_14620 [Bacteroidia bacterium]